MPTTTTEDRLIQHVEDGQLERERERERECVMKRLLLFSAGVE